MAGCPRVTHPSATKISKNLPKLLQRLPPFDLHVLSTPPAFILSQDQTLDLNFDLVKINLGCFNLLLLCFLVRVVHVPLNFFLFGLIQGCIAVYLSRYFALGLPAAQH